MGVFLFRLALSVLLSFCYLIIVIGFFFAEIMEGIREMSYVDDSLDVI